MSTILFVLAPIVGVAVGFLALRWALRSHREDRAPWLELLRVPARDAANAGGAGALDGLANVGSGDLVAPFSGRRCLAFTCEIITEEQFGNQTTWQRVFQDGAGHFVITGPDGQRRGDVDLRGGRSIFPLPLSAHRTFSLDLTAETVFQGTPQTVPPHLVAFVQQLDPETAHLIARPSGQLVGGKRVYFNERIVIPGQPVVAAGPCAFGPEGVRVLPNETEVVSLGLGSVESERARVAKLPIAGELFGAILAGGLASAAVCMVASVLAK